MTKTTQDIAALRKRLLTTIAQHNMMSDFVVGLKQVDPMYQQCLDALDQLEAERQKVRKLSASEWNLAGELVALQGSRNPVAYAVRNHFWKGGRANFQGKYHDLHFAESLKSTWDVQIPLFTNVIADWPVTVNKAQSDAVASLFSTGFMDDRMIQDIYDMFRLHADPVFKLGGAHG